MEPVGRLVERFLDIRGEAVEFDGALGQAPQAKTEEEDQRRGDRSEPHQEAMRPLSHPHRCRSAAFGRTGRLARSAG